MFTSFEKGKCWQNLEKAEALMNEVFQALEGQDVDDQMALYSAMGTVSSIKKKLEA